MSSLLLPLTVYSELLFCVFMKKKKIHRQQPLFRPFLLVLLAEE